MNPTIIVQQNIEIPAGPNNKAASKPQSTKTGKSVAAIIRPMPRDTGREGTIRLDTANSSRSKPHVRPTDLTDYVSWLEEKFQQDANDSRTSGEPETVSEPTKRPTLEFEPVVAEVVHVSATDTENQLPQSYFSSITTEASVPDELASESEANVEDPANRKQPIATPEEPATHRGFSTSKLNRVDQPHDGLPKAYVAFDELKVGSDGGPAVSIASSLVKKSDAVVVPPLSRKLTVKDTENFISTISKAIASVLTETPEPEFEQKVRTHFESELHARAVSAIAPEEVAAINADKLDQTSVADLVESGGVSVEAMNTEAKKIASEILTSARKEVPTSVAAWDVEDFRWPVVTNQMIVSGSQALDQLSKSTFEMTSPGNHRVAIAGLGRGEGTTSIAMSLARWTVASGKNVLLVDADLVTPGLTTQVGLAPNLSWINAVSQSLDPSEVIVRSQKSNLCVMPLAQMVSRVTWPRFIYDNLGDLIEKVQMHFDLIILDVGPANQLMAELSRPSLLVDATLLVHNGVNSPEFQKTKSRLEMFGLNKFIVAQNRAQKTSANVA